MKSVKFYFSQSLKLTKQEVIVNDAKTILATGNLIGKISNFPRITICSIYDDEKEVMVFGVARCAPKDTFVKATGREIAFKRAIETPYRVTKVSKNTKVSEVFIKNCHEIEDEVLSMEYPISIK